MYKIGFLLTLFSVLCISMSAQELFGIRRVTVKAGTVSDAPRPESERYKVRFTVLKDAEVKIYFHEYVNGQYVHEKFDHLNHLLIPASNTFVAEFVPELQESGILKLYANNPGSSCVRRKYPSVDKILKFVSYETTDPVVNSTTGMPNPVILVYEDNKEGEVEKKINRYLKKGKLQVNNKDVVYSKIDRYAILYYTVNYK